MKVKQIIILLASFKSNLVNDSAKAFPPSRSCKYPNDKATRVSFALLPGNQQSYVLVPQERSRIEKVATPGALPDQAELLKKSQSPLDSVVKVAAVVSTGVMIDVHLRDLQKDAERKALVSSVEGAVATVVGKVVTVVGAVATVVGAVATVAQARVAIVEPPRNFRNLISGCVRLVATLVSAVLMVAMVEYIRKYTVGAKQEFVVALVFVVVIQLAQLAVHFLWHKKQSDTVAAKTDAADVDSEALP